MNLYLLYIYAIHDSLHNCFVTKKYIFSIVLYMMSMLGEWINLIINSLNIWSVCPHDCQNSIDINGINCAK